MSSTTLKSVFIASVSHIINEAGEIEIHSTPTWPLIEYFRRRCERLVVVELPLPKKGMFFQPQAVVFCRGVFIERKVMPKIISLPFKISDCKIQPRTYFRFKVRDMFAVVWFMLRYRKPYELFIGVESLLAIMGGFFKRFGWIKKTVYYISDWSPVKYSNRILNWIYIKMDWWACKWSDFIWNYTYTISEARRDILGYDMGKIGKEITVPFGFVEDGVVRPDIKDIDKKRLIYCGGIGPEYGVDLIMDALPLIKARIPEVKIDIFGDGPGITQLKKKAEDSGVNGCIAWHGYVSDRQKILEYYLKAAVSLAPFAPLEDSVKKYGDVIKIRESIGCGVPVVTTAVAPSHKEIMEKGLGEVVECTPEALAGAVVRLLTDTDYYAAARKRVIAASKDNLWEDIYNRTLGAMGYNTAPLYT